MKIKKIWGAGGSGKSHMLAKYLVDQKNQNPDFNFLILSYTHVGKNEIYKKYLQFKGEDITKFHPFKNYKECKTLHSLVYNILKAYLTRDTKKKKITDYLKKQNNELEMLEELKVIVSKLFLKEFQDKKKIFDINFKELSKKVLDLDDQRKRVLYDLFEKLNQINEGEGDISVGYLLEKMRSLKKDELVFLILLLEGNIYDLGDIIDPFKQKVIDSKIDFVLKKYYSLFKIDPKDRLLEALETVLDEDYASPLHPIYNMRKLYKTLVDKGFRREIDVYDIIILDEAQDIPEIFIQFLKKFYNTKELIMAGDPYQAIFLDLGFNSQFMKREKNTTIMKTLWRYDKSYLLNIKRYIRYPVLTIDLLENFRNSNKTFFGEIKLFFPKGKRDSYIEAVKEVIKNYGLSNSTDKVFLTHNIKKYILGIRDILFLPYKEFYDIKIGTITNYLTFLLLVQEFEPKLKEKAKVLFERLVNYYNYYPLPKNLVLFSDYNKEKEFWKKWNINKTSLDIDSLMKNDNLKKAIYNILKNKYLIVKDYKNEDILNFVIYLTTHRSKGKTLEEDIFYIPSKGLYYYLEKEFGEYYFIHYLLKYVSLTRASKRLYYINVKTI